MTNELWYWIFLGVLCIAPFALGIYLMIRTKKIAVSFMFSSALGAILTGSASVWWVSVNDDPFTIRLGIVFYVIAFVNVAVLEIFALLSMKKEPNETRSIES